MNKSIRLFVMAITIVLCVILLPKTDAQAAEEVASGSCGDNVLWSLDSDGTLTISGTGAIPDYNHNSLPWRDYMEQIKKAMICSGVTGIGNSAFSQCYYLSEITIPNSVASIGERAFYYCRDLTVIAIPDSVTSIGTYAFYGCSGLKSVTISNGVTSIEDYTFTWCSSLTNITIPDSVTTIGEHAFEQSGITSITIGKCVISIEGYAFASCSKLTGLTIPDSVKSIGKLAFCNCSNLTSVTIPDSVKSIGEYAFDGCSSLTNVCYTGTEDQWNAIEIGSNNDPLTKADIKYNYVPLVDSGYCGAGSGGTNLTWTLDIEGVLTISGEGKMEDYSSDGAPWHSYLSQIKEVILEYGVTSIGGYAFDGCSSLAGLTIPEGVTSIGEYALSNCSSLMSVTIPDSVTSIGEYAFDGCSSLTDVYYMGTEDQWNEIEIGSNNVPLTDADIHFYVPIIASGYCGTGSDRTNLTWTLDIEGKLTISGEGSMGKYYNAYYGFEKFPWYSYRKSVKKVVVNDGVTSIDTSAFGGFSNLEAITLPFVGSSCEENPTTQHTYPCFGYIFGTTTWGDTGLVGVEQYYLFNGESKKQVTYYIPESLRSVTITGGGDILYCAFMKCAMITEINLSNGVTSVGESAFSDCSDLTEINLSDSVTSIGSCAFSGCSSLNKISIGKGVTYINLLAFIGCAELSDISVNPENTAYCVEDDVLYTTKKTDLLKCSIGKTGEYSVPDSITAFGVSAFEGCSGLTSVTLPDGITYISNFAFTGCSSLTSVNIPKGVTHIGAYAFSGCSGLTNIDIPDSVTHIGAYAFSGCSGLTNIDIPDSVTLIGEYAFTGCSRLTDVNIPEGVTHIGAYTFSGCSGLTSIDIPDSVTQIDEYAFSGCSGLTRFDVPDSVTHIGYGAFADCKALESMTIPFVGDYRYTASSAYQYPFGCIFGTHSGEGLIAVSQSFYGGAFNGEVMSRTYYIPSSLRTVIVTGGEVLYGAFMNCSMLTHIVVPHNITSIDEHVFYGCTSLRSIYLPGSITSIWLDAFAHCGSLKDIYFAGNESDLDGVVLREDGSNLGVRDFFSAQLRFREGADWHAKAEIADVFIAAVDGQIVCQATVYCRADMEITSCLAAYSSQGKFLGYVLQNLTPGTDNTLSITKDGYASVRVYAMSSSDFMPICAYQSIEHDFCKLCSC